MTPAFFLWYWSRRFYEAREASARRTIDRHRHFVRSRNPLAVISTGGVSAAWPRLAVPPVRTEGKLPAVCGTQFGDLGLDARAELSVVEPGRQADVPALRVAAISPRASRSANAGKSDSMLPACSLARGPAPACVPIACQTE